MISSRNPSHRVTSSGVYVPLGFAKMAASDWHEERGLKRQLSKWNGLPRDRLAGRSRGTFQAYRRGKTKWRQESVLWSERGHVGPASERKNSVPSESTSGTLLRKTSYVFFSANAWPVREFLCRRSIHAPPDDQWTLRSGSLLSTSPLDTVQPKYPSRFYLVQPRFVYFIARLVKYSHLFAER